MPGGAGYRTGQDDDARKHPSTPAPGTGSEDRECRRSGEDEQSNRRPARPGSQAENAEPGREKSEGVPQMGGAPTFHHGLTKPDWALYLGTGTLRRKIFHRAINELLASWDDHGIKEVVIISAQRHEPHIEALLTALTGNATTEIVDLMTIEVTPIVEGHP